MPASIPGSVDSPDDIRLALRSWPEVERYLESCKGIIIPLGSTEQHGPTGAIGTDALTAEAVSLAVGRRSGVLVTPAQCFGMAEHHLGFAGTMSLQPATLLAVLRREGPGVDSNQPRDGRQRRRLLRGADPRPLHPA